MGDTHHLHFADQPHGPLTGGTLITLHVGEPGFEPRREESRVHSWCLRPKGKKKRQDLRSQSRVHPVEGGVPGRAQTGHLGVPLSLLSEEPQCLLVSLGENPEGSGSLLGALPSDQPDPHSPGARCPAPKAGQACLGTKEGCCMQNTKDHAGERAPFHLGCFSAEGS